MHNPHIQLELSFHLTPQMVLEELYSRLSLPPYAVYNGNIVTTISDVWVTVEALDSKTIRVTHNHKTKRLGSIQEYSVEEDPDNNPHYYEMVGSEIKGIAKQIAMQGRLN